MTHTELQQAKRQVLAELRYHIPEYKTQMDEIDARLFDYVADAIREDCDTANIYELLGIRKVLRLMDCYQINRSRVVRIIRAIEGVWSRQRSSGSTPEKPCGAATEADSHSGSKTSPTHHVAGGLKFDTPRGHQHVRLMPYQVWCIFGIYGFDTEVCMEQPWSEVTALMHLPTEFERDGMLWDRRRLCTEAHIFQTRKSGKTEFGAALDFVEANILGPSNAQVLICCNSKEQAKIAYKAIKEFCYQIDPQCTSKAGGKYLRVTADETTWMPGGLRNGEIKVMSAGGKTKDGLYASLVHADEHGSASYVKDHSDMQSLVEVCVGSMGPRRERLLMHTTTAGLVNEGPYQLQLRTVEQSLLTELDIPLGSPQRTAEDGWFAFLLRLDPWEEQLSLEELNQDHLFRKVNRSIGVTVQPTWYRERLHDAAKNEDTRKEVLTKDFNIWQTSRVKQWLTASDIYPLQEERSVTDLTSDWVCFVGCDFSKGDDLNALSYLCYNPETGEFFADMDAWITEETLHEHTNAALYQLWHQQGWLRVCPGRTISEDMVTARLMEVAEHPTILRIGYDAYDSKRFINAFGAWIFSLGQDPTAFLQTVSQTFATYNSPVQEMTFMVKNDPPLIRFSKNPLWGWEFGNCMLQESNDGMENVKPVKANTTGKVDNVQALLSALHLYDQAQGTVSK